MGNKMQYKYETLPNKNKFSVYIILCTSDFYIAIHFSGPILNKIIEFTLVPSMAGVIEADNKRFVQT